MFYWYISCKHDYSNTWCYDSNGNITIDPSTWTETVIREATCMSEGYVVNACDRCGESQYYNINKTAHINNGDGSCKFCGVALVTAENEGKYLVFANGNTFTSSGEGEYVSNNTGKNDTSAIMTFVANADMEVSFIYSVSSEQGYDMLLIAFNGKNYVNVSGETGLKEITFELSKGDEVSFTYDKDGSAASGNDCAIIHSIAILYTNEVIPEEPETGTEIDTDIGTEIEPWETEPAA